MSNLPGPRNFTSAFGDQRSGRSVRTPLSLYGNYGDIVSTGMDGCDTPLFISLAAQTALSAVFDPCARVWDARALGVTVPLIPLGGHLSVRVYGWSNDSL